MSYIIVRAKGGIGNQLFIYAHGRSLSKQNKSKLIIDNLSAYGKHDIYRSQYVLDSLINRATNLSNLSFLKTLVGNRFFWSLLKRFTPLVLQEKSNFEVDYQALNYKQHFNVTFTEGYWHSPTYFANVKDEIIKDLNLAKKKYLNNSSKTELFDKDTLPSVAVGLRFFQEVKKPEFYHRPILKEYYHKALALIRCEIGNFRCIIFSNNKELAKDFFDFPEEKVFVSPSDSDHEDFFLMMNCQHFIISNSTFHWWAAYAGQSSGSVVVAPEQGIKNKDMVPPEWKKL